MHYYQPGWTLVGGGIKSVDFTTKPMKDVLPKNADWIKSKVVSFDPDNSKLSTDGGDDISYEYLVIAMGMQLRYEDVSRNSKFGFYKSSSFLKIPRTSQKTTFSKYAKDSGGGAESVKTISAICGHK